MRPDLETLLARARDHVMTPAEIEAQRRSWVRDWETCPDCWAEHCEPQRHLSDGETVDAE